MGFTPIILKPIFSYDARTEPLHARLFLSTNPSSICIIFLFSSAICISLLENLGRFELLLNAIHGKARRWVNIIIEVITIVFALLIMTFGGSIITRMQMVQSDSSLHIPMGVIYAIVPICGVITIFYCICNIREERMALKEGV